MSVPSRSSLDVSVVTGESMPIDVEPGRALARPMHEAAPVTMATLSLRSMAGPWHGPPW